MEVNGSALSVLIGQEIISLSKVVIKKGISKLILKDILIFEMSTKRYELLVRQGEYIFKDLSNVEPLFVDFALDADETLILEPVSENQLLFPIEVKSVIEYWAGHDANKFLIAFVCQNVFNEAVLCLAMTDDEIEILTHKPPRSYLDQLESQYGEVNEYRYD